MQRGDLRRWVVPVAAVAALALRLPGLAGPVTSDEAGFTIVARTWDPAPDSVYGPHFVDRTPLLIAVFRVADLVGPVWAVRLLGALGAALTVVLVAAAARSVAGPSAARWSAVVVAALVTTPFIDPVSVNGELLALPLLAGCLWASLRATATHTTHPVAWSVAAGCAGMLAVGMKQNLVGGLVFAGVLVVVRSFRGGLPRRDGTAALAGLAVGAAAPVVALVAWTVAAGVDLGTLWHTVYGFRAEASRVLEDGDHGATYQRLRMLLVVAVGSGIAAVLVGLAVQLPRAWRADPGVTAATAAMVVVQLGGLVGGGSYWRDYLFPLVPTVGMALALLSLRHGGRTGTKTRAIVAVAVGSTVVGFVGWTVSADWGAVPADGERLGRTIGAAADPGDTMVVFGGHAEVAYAAGTTTPYRHLWSLPMRTLDPEYRELGEVLAGPDAPVWFVQWWYVGTWSEDGGRRIAEAVGDRYELHATCGEDKEVFLRRDVERPPLPCTD
ncbi:hypothetical protein KUV85_09490 [Nocardioides panacisoli]|uniref:ArnT family glycosyltransferase n=1 Tax=Nocardioides panacisoli TaxID=627624 RepID=UPI001C62C4CA|nr:hypothetical protein [Nocardioides panacisoli]QYJ02572.1 hypothetical protein KUV85_09490 [Nocardioides panacisoli]